VRRVDAVPGSGDEKGLPRMSRSMATSAVTLKTLVPGAGGGVEAARDTVKRGPFTRTPPPRSTFMADRSADTDMAPDVRSKQPEAVAVPSLPAMVAVSDPLIDSHRSPGRAAQAAGAGDSLATTTSRTDMLTGASPGVKVKRSSPSGPAAVSRKRTGVAELVFWI
jgi:hypothetical protein